MSSGHDEDICTVCLEVVNDNAAVLPCRHKFHSMCVIKSYLFNSSCPTCRGSSVSPPNSRIEEIGRLAFNISLPINVERQQSSLDDYRNRVNRLERVDEVAKKNRMQMTATKRQVMQITEELSDLIRAHHETLKENIRNDESVNEVKSLLTKTRRSFNRYKRIREKYIVENIGERPSYSPPEPDRTVAYVLFPAGDRGGSDDVDG
jgi:hypothetical protein